MDNRTYSETKNNTKFNWFDVLQARVENKQDSNSEHSYQALVRKAGSWTTCACGNQCAIIPRYNDGSPMDSKLGKLGMDFYHRIVDAEYSEAINILEQIEVRSSELIEEIREADEKKKARAAAEKAHKISMLKEKILVESKVLSNLVAELEKLEK
jgi:hypothetical protein